MAPEALAGVSALLFAASHIASKRGVQDTSVTSGLLISLLTGWVVLIAAVLLDPPGAISPSAVATLAVSGAIAPALGRAGAIAGVDRLGPSRSVPVQASVYPFFAVGAASVVLGEALGVAQAVGVAAIVVGVWLISSGGGQRSAPDLCTPPSDDPPGRLPNAAFAFPVIAGLAYGGGDIIRKQALERQPDPTFGALIAVGVAALLWSFAAVAIPQVRSRLKVGRQARWFALSGVLTSGALLSQFHALGKGDVSIVSPIVAAQPLAVFALSAVFLKGLEGLERLTATTIAGGVAIVAGTMMVPD